MAESELGLIIGPKASGKTHLAIQIAIEEEAYLAVRHRARQRQIEEEHDVETVSYDDLLNNQLQSVHPNRVVIDNADDFLEHVTKSSPVVGATMSPESVVDLGEPEKPEKPSVIFPDEDIIDYIVCPDCKQRIYGPSGGYVWTCYEAYGGCGAAFRPIRAFERVE